MFPLPLWNDSWDVALTSSGNQTSLQENHLPPGVFGNTSGKGGYQRKSRASFILASDSTECPGSVMCHPHSLLCLQGRLLFINKLFINKFLNFGVRNHLKKVTSELFSLSFPNYGILMPKINIESTVMGWIIIFSYYCAAQC